MWNLVLGIIIKPIESFRKIKKQKPFWQGSLIFFIVFCIFLILTNIAPKFFYGSFKNNFLFCILSYVGIFCEILLIHFLSILLGGKGSFVDILLCLFFIGVITILFFPLFAFILLSNLWQLYYGVALIVLLWQLILTIMAIREVYSISSIKSAFTAVLLMIIYHSYVIMLGMSLK